MRFGKAKLCEKEFPAIASCMTNGKNHMPCCFNDGIPESCSNLCKGHFRPGIDSIVVSTFCKKYIPPTLSCIALGRETIPLPPLAVAADALHVVIDRYF